MSASQKSNDSYPKLWFVCKFCKRAYPKKRQLILHKKVSHKNLTRIPKKNQAVANSVISTVSNAPEEPQPKLESEPNKETKNRSKHTSSSKRKLAQTLTVENQLTKTERESGKQVVLRRLCTKMLAKTDSGKLYLNQVPGSSAHYGTIRSDDVDRSKAEKTLTSVPSPMNSFSSAVGQTSKNIHQEYILVNVSTASNGSHQVEFSSTFSPTGETPETSANLPE